jgi:thiol:disulfide interchange protein
MIQKLNAMKAISIKSLVLLLLTFYGVAGAQSESHEGISFFNGTLKEAIAKAENKFVFFDAYASWCGPCKAMDKDVFTDKTVSAYLNAKFVSIRIDMEKGEGPVLAKKYASINGYPSLLFLDNGGMALKTLLGSRDAEEFLAEAKLVAK